MIPRTTVDFGEEEQQAILRVFESGQYVKGKECQFLEEEFSGVVEAEEMIPVNLYSVVNVIKFVESKF